MAKGIAFFDFDGTITTTDSYFQFLLFCFGWKGVIGNALKILPILFSYAFKFCDNETAKQSITSTFFRGMSESKFDELCRNFVDTKLDSIVRPNALEKIKWHQEQGHKARGDHAEDENADHEDGEEFQHRALYDAGVEQADGEVGEHAEDQQRAEDGEHDAPGGAELLFQKLA